MQRKSSAGDSTPGWERNALRRMLERSYNSQIRGRMRVPST